MTGLERTRRTRGTPRSLDLFFSGHPFATLEHAFGLEPFLRSAGEVGPKLGGFEFRPSFEVKETPGSYVVTGDLPGVKDEDVNVTLAERVLRIEGHREEERHETAPEDGAKDGEKTPGHAYHLTERAYGSFVRSFELPDDADPAAVSAEMKNGVLQVVVNKRVEATPKTVKVAVSKK